MGIRHRQCASVVVGSLINLFELVKYGTHVVEGELVIGDHFKRSFVMLFRCFQILAP